MDYASIDKDFNMLSLRDLLEARDLYHVHLAHKENVVGTAVGRYLIRSADPWPEPGRKGPESAQSKGPRTLANSEIRPYSWPCILVFVENWVDASAFGVGEGKVSPINAVPKALYMPDGRVVPVCVVEAPRDESAPATPADMKFPDNLIGGGFPVIADVQQQTHIASIGCMLTDGHRVYALTNRHVAGEPGEVVYAVLAGRKVRIGVSSDRQLTRRPFDEVYSGWPGKNVYVNLDIGLIDVDDRNLWTAQVYGIGAIGKVVDLSVENLSLKLIGCPVRAFGCASGQMYGAVHGLFYRYKSAGGFEYVSDFLIGPRKDKPFTTHPGDSGTLWLLDLEDRDKAPMPLAVQWGGHVFVDGAKQSRLPYALATCLSTVCDLLEVDTVRDWNTGQTEYWGAVGHYTIANKACNAIANPNLRALMSANVNRISYAADDITARNMKGLSKRAFVPLADVPDMVWKIGRYSRGNPEHPNHFADMDKPGPDGGTLLDICKDHPKNVSVPVWQQYYDRVKDASRGLLPFRVWQFYNAMVDFVKQGKVEEFVCAAGIVSHYVGDACQPLHISYMFNGDPNDTEEVDGKQAPRAAGVHAAYEDSMVDYHVPEIMAGIDREIGVGERLPLIQGGQAAAVAIVELMQDTFARLSPPDIVAAFLEVKGESKRVIGDALWEKFGRPTVDVITGGSKYLAMIWDSAWKEGGGDDTIAALGAIEEETLAGIYQPRDFLKSYTLDQIGPVLGFPGPKPPKAKKTAASR